jgi:hypothetical protein
MLSPAQAVVNDAELVGAMIIAAALADWALNDPQRRWLTDRAARTRDWVGHARRRSLLDMVSRTKLQRVFLALVFLCEALLVRYLAQHMSYQGRDGAATARDVLVAELLLFIAPLCVAALVLITAGPRVVDTLSARGHLPACLAKCFAAALVADLLAYGAIVVMDKTFLAFGPRALLDGWDLRLWIYAAEYAVTGAIVSVVMISNLLFVACAAAGAATLAVGLTVLQADVLARTVAHYPKRGLLAGSTAVAGLAAIVQDWL